MTTKSIANYIMPDSKIVRAIVTLTQNFIDGKMTQDEYNVEMLLLGVDVLNSERCKKSLEDALATIY